MLGSRLIPLFLLLATGAHAGVPDILNSTFPPCIPLVGFHAVTASPLGEILATIRDASATPLEGEPVTLDFSLATDLFIAGQQLDADVEVDCFAKTVTKLTDANGEVRFRVIGYGNGAISSQSTINKGRIFVPNGANGGLFHLSHVMAYDLDGHDGVGANDLSLWLSDFSNFPTIATRSDYDCSGIVGANDLSLWLDAFGGASTGGVPSMIQSGTCP